MTLADLLFELQFRGLEVRVAGGQARVRGGTLDDALRGALAEHKPALLRLYRDADVAWRGALLRLSPADQEAWCQLVEGYDRVGCTARGAEWLAWDKLSQMLSEVAR
ncbi:MAG: hypothetical protein HGA98_01210 [Deltaproteobacteria bacterium]|nr:hypothetical protein [Deltaproteobacteria bacterium]